jgi:hypothetical protein
VQRRPTALTGRWFAARQCHQLRFAFTIQHEPASRLRGSRSSATSSLRSTQRWRSRETVCSWTPARCAMAASHKRSPSCLQQNLGMHGCGSILSPSLFAPAHSIPVFLPPLTARRIGFFMMSPNRIRPNHEQALWH